ncbi:MAG: hypothetical protein ACOCVZ_03320 [Gemmatimonadota bacterium]
MEQEPMDLSPLDPQADQLAYERLIHRIMDAAAPELARRAESVGPLALVAGWARPTMAAAAVLAAFAAGALLTTDRPMEAAAEPASMVDALGIPAPAAQWLEEEREPTRGDLVLAVERRR